VSHLGMGAFDVAVGYQAYKLAVEKGLGLKLKLF
jgi:ornithine cyclodeaminase/alanine dehydrogenase-like protein (mu-crystallin family)